MAENIAYDPTGAWAMSAGRYACAAVMLRQGDEARHNRAFAALMASGKDAGPGPGCDPSVHQ